VFACLIVNITPQST